jgi:hypothetical protein
MAIILMDIDGYFIVAICCYFINGYYINGYWWLFVFILLMAIDGYLCLFY